MRQLLQENSVTNSGIQVIARAAAVLRALKEHREGLSLGQIATAVDLPRSTVQRIIKALLAERLVIQASPLGGYRLGPEIQAMAAAGQTEVVDLVRPYITALSKETGETVDLAEARNDHMIFIDQIVGTHRLRTAATVGEIFPLTTTANGKACLALLDDTCIEQQFNHEHGINHNGKNNQSNLDRFLQEIGQIRIQGYAYDLDEHTLGISAVGASFLAGHEQIYAVSIPVPTPRFLEKQASLTEYLLQTMQQIKGLFDKSS